MKYHFIGIGGIGMSALARILLQKGEEVSGSDVSTSYYTEKLQKEGAKVFHSHGKENIKAGSRVIYSTMIAEKNPEFQKANELKLEILHRSDLLTELSSGSKALYVAGTHGKTTTTALLAAVFVQAKLDPSFAIGGMLGNTTNGKWGKGEYFILEADESDGSLLKGKPFGAIVTNIEKEHLDYWKTEENLEIGFQEFCQKVEIKELLFWCKDDPYLRLMSPKGTSYGTHQDADLKITSFRQEGFRIYFTITFEGKIYKDLSLPLIGFHNVLNAAAVMGLSLKLNIPEAVIRAAFYDFPGIGRRMEYLGSKIGIDFFDDYAHHPTEIATTLNGLKQAIGQRRLVAVFQPHRYTRAKDLFHEFTNAFVSADLVVVTDIHAAYETPIPGITGQALYQEISKIQPAIFIPRSELDMSLLHYLSPNDLVITLGAGDITNLGRKMV
ncbi:MAG TPA: UDP-N-acetylmuramate--L-alanine ligase [Chlamydiales bacterium]|nr:UDP-N-acetylmuramate--L-alanine ligase [Chlamydiales bacterium]